MLNWLIETRGNRSQYKMAAEIGISQSYYASIEVGSRRPSVEVAKKIGGTMGFEWTRFFEDQDREDEKAPPKVGAAVKVGKA